MMKAPTKTAKLLSLILAFMLVSVLSFTGCGSKPTASAGQGLDLTVYGSCDEEHVARVCEAFEKSTGVKTTFVRMSTGEVYARIKEEAANPQAGVWYGGPNDPYIVAASEGLLAPYEAQNAKNLLSEAYIGEEGRWYGIYSGYIGFICNEDLLKEKNLPVPTSWADLIDPKYQNCISFANPGASGTGYNIVSTLVQLMGEKEAMEYLSALDKNIKQYPKTGGGPSKLVGSGELEIAIGMLHDGITQQKLGYDNVVLSAPSEGTGYEIGATAIIANSKQEEAAKLFIEFALTPECQQIGQEVGAYQFLTVEGAKNPPEADVLSNTKLIDYDFSWSADNRERLVNEWNKYITADKIVV
ncbi:ABC transporter substrate-binding protein [Oscillospiraceae bacterium MB08-C2-2]|nr:ABC transporter substrate-binding protein [Oscillospiraceae bacterium MB08-C2-2]